MKTPILVMVLFFAASLTLSGCYALPSFSPEMREAFLVVEDIDLAKSDIESYGGVVRHIFPDKNVLIGSFTGNSLKSKFIDRVYYERSRVPYSVRSEFTSWKRSLEYKKVPFDEREVPDVEPIYDDMVIIDKPSLSDLDPSIPLPIFGGDPTDTSSFFIGDISVNVIFPESNANSLNTENWTDNEIQEVKDEIFLGMDWWALREPDAHLTFVYNYDERIPTDLEPIEHESYYDWYWINDVMLNLGYGPEQYPPTPLVYNYVNNMRSNDDWGFAIFVVDSSNDADGMFLDGKSAYTVMTSSGGGPYIVMTYDNGGYTISNMDSVTAHETGHIFGSTDQYSCSCDTQHGYLYYENQNCGTSCLIDEDSIMKNPIYSFSNGLLDYYARGQVGWQDTDTDNILDIIDTFPMINLNPYTQEESGFIFDGDSQVSIFPAVNPYYNNITTNIIANVDYSYMRDGEPWSDWFSTDAIDGMFDGPQELFEFILSSLPGGDYTVKARATNNEGNFNESDHQYITITAIPPMCSETDGGYDIFNYGYATDDYGTYEDACNRRILFEYYCGGEGYVEVAEVSCKYGCGNGACGEEAPLDILPVAYGSK